VPRQSAPISLSALLSKRTKRLYRRATAPLRILPDFLIVGAQKAGTSSLHYYLESHPQLVGPRDRKELHFFDRHFSSGVGHYKSYFPTIAGRALRATTSGAPILAFESTPEYMLFPQASARIHEVLGPIPLIALLRDPIDRAWSAYRMYANYDLDATFEEVLNSDADLATHEGRSLDPAQSTLTRRFQETPLLTRGLYADQLRTLYEHWPRERVHVIDFADLCRDPAATTTAILERLGLPPLERDSWPAVNANEPAAFPTELRDRLKSYYDASSADLRSLLEWTPSWMRES
jgi:hypothetical protein